MRKISLLFVFVFIFTILFISQGYGLRPDSIYHVNPNHFGLVYKKISFTTEDNISLRGWLIPSQPRVELDSANLPAYYESPIENNYNTSNFIQNPTIIICNGDGGNMCYNVWMANEFMGQGFNVFLFDWRGFGESQNWNINPDYLVLPEFLLDYGAAIDIVSKQPEVDPDKICLYGFSTGFYLSFAMAVTNPHVKCLAGRAIITDAYDLKDCLATVKDTSNIIIPDDYPEELYPINCAYRLKVPIFFFVGEHDERTPLWMTKKVYSKVKSPKKLKVFPDEAHCNIELNQRSTIFNEMGDFFKKSLLLSESLKLQQKERDYSKRLFDLWYFWGLGLVVIGIAAFLIYKKR